MKFSLEFFGLNSSFERGTEFSFQNWTGNKTSFNSDTPNSESRYSLQIEPGWVPTEGFVETLISGLEGTILLHFSCDAKTTVDPGKIIILKEDVNGNRTEISNVSFNNHEWQNISLNNTANLVSTDLLVIHLSAGTVEVSSSKVLFDNISVTYQ